MRTSVRRMSSSARTTRTSFTCGSFLASRDRVKGTRRRLAAGAVATAAASRGGSGLVLGLDQGGLAALGERPLDRVEVARDDRVREHRAGLVAHVAREVTGREMGQREHAHAGV